MAISGDKHMIRLILELHMSRPQAQEDSSSGRNQVNILVQNLTDKKKQVEVIDVEATPAGDDRHSEGDAEVNSPVAETSSDDGKQ
jgi:hypothetical protein